MRRGQEVSQAQRIFTNAPLNGSGRRTPAKVTEQGLRAGRKRREVEDYLTEKQRENLESFEAWADGLE